MDNNSNQKIQNVSTNRKSTNPKSKILSAKSLLSLAAALIVIMIAIYSFSVFGGKTQGKYLDKNKLQSVFLNTGQVYFGNIKSFNKESIVLDNIFYLQTTTASGNSSTNVNLIKLGCEIHAPEDRMIINLREVTFWENLSSNGKVANAVANYQKNNPKGQNCSNQVAPSGNGSTNPQSSTSN
jgi:hypothetical protein